MSSKRGPPKHQNKYAWKPNAGCKINETEVGGSLKPYSEITGVCPRCKQQIEWKRKYGKYKPLSEPAKCQKCSKRAVRQAYHNLCTACAKEQNVCAKCSSRVDHIIGRDSAELQAEQKMLEEAIKNARERDRRTLLRVMNRGKSHASGKIITNSDVRAGGPIQAASIEEYVEEVGKDNDEEDSNNCEAASIEENVEEVSEDDDEVDNDDSENEVLVLTK